MKTPPHKRKQPKSPEDINLALAKVGVEALVDEATGYQEIRAKDALLKRLKKHLNIDLGFWTIMIPQEFYIELFRLKGWKWKDKTIDENIFDETKVRDSMYELILSRINLAIYNSLRIVEPEIVESREKENHYWVAPGFDETGVKTHLTCTTALMRTSDTWQELLPKMDKVFPKNEKPIFFPNSILNNVFNNGGKNEYKHCNQ